MVRRSVEDLKFALREQDSEIRVNSTQDQVIIDADPRRVERIMRNLVGNAIDHAENKPIDIKIDANDEAISISVRDYGVGLAPQHIDRVFDRFWRADPSRSRIRGGTGLGLSIAREDAQLHGGEIRVWGELNQGSNFVLTIPRVQGSSHIEPVISEVPTL